MMRLPYFRYHAPSSVREAVERLASAPGDAMIIGGGTDILPNMKRRQQCPATLIGLRGIEELKRVSNDGGLTIGAGVTLANLIRQPDLARTHRGLWQAAAHIATPLLRNMGTVGGNLCLDTRCNYYDQNYEWRKAINFCMKKDGDICWVATSSRTCLAVSSTDLAPMLVALGASVTLVDAEGQRRVAVSDLYRNDGIHYTTRRPTELLTSVHVPATSGWQSVYWKLRRRGSFDFPVMSVAAAVKLSPAGIVEAARVVLGAIASCPLEMREAGTALTGGPLSDDAIARAADLAAKPARPMDNTDFSLIWRKRVIKDFVTYALREIRGDDVRDIRRKLRSEDLGVKS
jgi:4-hydroxybenzoyl-CoA reductase subunit beta